jgi:hypothetical protein
MVFYYKVKVNCSCAFFLTKHHAIKAYWGVEVQLHTFLDLGTRWRRVISFMPLVPIG